MEHDKIGLTLVLLLAFSAGPSPGATGLPPVSVDNDRDGVDDAFEQGLLARFAPIWMISSKDCDKLPAEFSARSLTPKAASKNGTVYGQVFRCEPDGLTGRFLEIHYYHLWSRDCGKAGHDLDAEHVSVLLTDTETQDERTRWKALYWYAAAHEDTQCDASSGARASALEAEYRGPTVWVSMGKHASYLRLEDCGGGCGVDRCESMRRLTPRRTVNLGERGEPMNGCTWTASDAWPLKDKLVTDFTPAVMERLKGSETAGVIPVHGALVPVKAAIMAGGEGADVLAAGKREAVEVAGAAKTEAKEAVGKGNEKTGNVLGRGLRAVGRLFGIGKKTDKAEEKPPDEKKE